MRVALIQMLVTTDKQKNLDTACSKIKEASGQGAHIAVLPEMFYCPYDNNLFSDYGEEEGGKAQRTISALAKELGTGGVKDLQHKLCVLPERQADRKAPQDPPV